MVAPHNADLDGPEALLVLLIDQTRDWDGMLPRYLNYFPFAPPDQVVPEALHLTEAGAHAVVQEVIVRQALEDDRASHPAADDQLNHNGFPAATREISENASHDFNSN